MASLIVWLDIPAKNLERAIKFYSSVLNIKVKPQSYGDSSIGEFPDGAGCVFESKEETGKGDMPLVYFTCDGRLEDAETKVTENGGEVLKPKHSIGQWGFRTVAKDSEGNKIALHSQS